MTTRKYPFNPLIMLIMVQTIFLSCSDLEFNNPVDPEAKSYNGGVSSSEQTPSSSVGADNHQPSSSSVSQNGSSSSTTPASSSSSSVVPSSSSSIVPSSIEPCGNTVTGDGTVSCGGQTYKTVNIGKTWMAENLNYNVTGSKCYGNSDGNCDKYGRLYDWATAMDFSSTCNSNVCADNTNTPHRGVCPEGWHIPSDADWDALMKHIHENTNGSPDYTSGTSAISGKYLKSKQGWNDCGVDGSKYPCLDEYGFTALPGGFGNSGGTFADINLGGNWWSTAEANAGNAYYRGIYSHSENARRSSNSKTYLYSIRCVKD